MKVAHDRSGVMNTAKLTTVAGVLAIIGGTLTGSTPQAAAGVIGVGALTALLTLGRRVEQVFLASLIGLLLGYMLQGRGFAYLGLPPLYIGEIVLCLGIFTLVIARTAKRVSPFQLILVGFMALGLLRTIPYVNEYGIDAFRDAALWYYGIYAIIVSLLLTRERLNTVVSLFGQILPFLVIWLVTMSVFFRFLPDSLPHFPGSPLPIISVMKASDRSVALVSLGAFVLVGLYSRASRRGQIPLTLFWLCWLASAVLVFAQNRGGLLAILLALMLIAVLHPSRQWLKPAFVGLSAILLMVIVDPTIETGGGRTISVGQMTTNITSIFSDETENQGGVQSTRNWRLEWWEDIWEYTAQGDHFWGGKGFGINLATDDGYQVTADESLRSPHSSHMTVLARMGVPGMLLWLGLHLSFGSQMLLSIIKSRARGQVDQARIKTWLLAMWTAAMVTSSFDVYLEGPQGAIVFWSVFGAGIAAMRMDSEIAGNPAGTHASRNEGVFRANPSGP